MQLFRRFSPDEAEMHSREGLHYLDRRKKEFNFNLAVENLKEAIKLGPEVGKYHHELGRAYATAPLLAVTRGISDGFVISESIELAVDELTKALKFDSSQAETYVVLGEAFMYLGKKQRAIEAFQAAVSVGSSSFLCISPLQFIDGLLLKSCANRRIKYLEQGTGEQPRPGVAQECIKRAILYRDEKRYNLADRELLQAFKLAPDWEWLYKTICKLAG